MSTSYTNNLDLVVDTSLNIEGDSYESFSDELITELDSISTTLKQQLSNKQRRVLISDLRNEKMSRPYVRERLRKITTSDFNSYLGSAKNPVNNDYSGIYVFGCKYKNEIIPVYVGISRNIVRRLYKHFWVQKSNSASWMYRIAQKYLQANTKNHKSQISELQEGLATKIYVTIYPLSEPYKMHMAEAYIASVLKTYWNTFKTH
ncbi:MAG: hypothetical protein AAF693_06560 [Bacteroidota bacterium]